MVVSTESLPFGAGLTTVALIVTRTALPAHDALQGKTSLRSLSSVTASTTPTGVMRLPLLRVLHRTCWLSGPERTTLSCKRSTLAKLSNPKEYWTTRRDPRVVGVNAATRTLKTRGITRTSLLFIVLTPTCAESSRTPSCTLSRTLTDTLHRTVRDGALGSVTCAMRVYDDPAGWRMALMTERDA
jgi:hypothetical protein